MIVTPFFAGSEAVIAHGGQHRGTAVLQDEQRAGLAMINALNAVLRPSKTGNDYGKDLLRHHYERHKH